MTNTQINIVLCAILSTLDESPDGAPESILYLAAQQAMPDVDWSQIEYVLVSSRLVTNDNHQMRITDRGREIAKKARDFRAKAVKS